MLNLYIMRSTLTGCYAAIVARTYSKAVGVVTGTGFWFKDWNSLYIGNILDVKTCEVYHSILNNPNKELKTNMGEFRIKGLNT